MPALPDRQTMKRGLWALASAGARERLTYLIDRENHLPLYAPGPHIDPDTAGRLRELIAARRRTETSTDMDIEFRRGLSREIVALSNHASLVDESGWAVAGRVPLPNSHSCSRLVRTPTGRSIYGAMPPLRGTASAVIPEAISLLDPLAANYAHFLDLILGRLALANEAGLSSVPLLLSQQVMSLPFCRAILQMNPSIGDRIVPVAGRIRVKRLYLIQASMDAKANAEHARGLVRPPEPSGDERLVLVRGRDSFGRCILNDAEFLDTCARFGYVPYDPAIDSLGDQAARFAGASHIVSAHGAALANIMFRAGGPLRLLEIFHRGIVREPFFALSGHYGFEYDALVSPAPRETMTHFELTTTPFAVDCVGLADRLARHTTPGGPSMVPRDLATAGIANEGD